MLVENIQASNKPTDELVGNVYKNIGVSLPKQYEKKESKTVAMPSTLPALGQAKIRTKGHWFSAKFRQFCLVRLLGQNQ